MRPANSPPAHDLGASPTRRGPRWIGRFTKPQLVQLVSFGLNGVSTAIVYSAAVWWLIAVSPTTFEFDVLLAYVIAMAANYLGSRLVFRAKTDMHGHVLRYLTVVAASSWLNSARVLEDPVSHEQESRDGRDGNRQVHRDHVVGNGPM